MLHYRTDCLVSLTSRAGDQFIPLFVAGTKVALEHPHLAKAVSAYLENRYSTSASAGPLPQPEQRAVSPAALTELTGWYLGTVADARTSRALEISPLPQGPAPSRTGSRPVHRHVSSC